jgi:peptidoglycan LD-endopeptidase LytH
MMKSSRKVVIKRMSPWRASILVLSCLCFIPCAVVLINLETPPQRVSRVGAPTQEAILLSHPARSSTVAARPLQPAAPTHAPPSSTGLSVSATSATGAGEADLVSLNSKKLLIPVAGVGARQLRDSFYDARSEGRLHQAIDIMAPSGTPVVAVADGTAARLYTSDRGGLMLYQMDVSGAYVYYYAHLQGYAEGMYQGKAVKRGETIAYVGDTGNAGPGNYHLHFGISKVSAPGKWHGGEPINPYSLLTEE